MVIAVIVDFIMAIKLYRMSQWGMRRGKVMGMSKSDVEAARCMEHGRRPSTPVARKSGAGIFGDPISFVLAAMS